MPDRYFPNPFHQCSSAAGASLQDFTSAALDIADGILKVNVTESWEIYTGSAGKAVLLHRALQAIDSGDTRRSTFEAASLSVARAAVRTAATDRLDVSWMLGQPGAWSLLAVLSMGHTASGSSSSGSATAATKSSIGKETEEALAAIRQTGRDIVDGKGRLGASLPNELLYGRVGFLWCTLWLERRLQAVLGHGQGNVIDASVTHTIIRQIMEAGAAHGLAGIVHVLLHYWEQPGALTEQDKRDVLGTLDHLLSIRFDGTGNLPSSEGKDRDRLVQWCHGAPGLALTLAMAYEVTRQEKYLQALREAVEVVWQRGLVRKLGLCHGIAGNVYPFLSLRRVLLGTAIAAGHAQQAEAAAEAEACLHKARAFTSFLLYGPDGPGSGASATGAQLRPPWWFQRQVAQGNMHGGDRPTSLYEGSAGVAYAILDVCAPDEARFPGYEL